MKKILTVLALCVFAAFAGTAATENLLEEAVFQPEKKNFTFWKVKDLEASTTVRNGVVKITVKTNKADKANLYNAQFIVPYNKGFKAGVHYRAEVTIKSSTDLKIAMNISSTKSRGPASAAKPSSSRKEFRRSPRSTSPPRRTSPATTASPCSPSVWLRPAARWRSPA